MIGPRQPRHEDPRWQYKVLWRYGALLLVAAGLLAMAFGASGLCNTAISVTLLPIGFVCLVAGVVLPRIEGRFSAGPSGLTAEMLAVHVLDQPRYAISGPLLGSETAETAEADNAGPGNIAKPATARIAMGDVWDALEARGIRPDQGAGGHAYFLVRGDRHLVVPNRSIMDWGKASDELLAVLKTWGVEPVASGKYPVRPDIDPEKTKRDAGYVQEMRTAKDKA